MRRLLRQLTAFLLLAGLYVLGWTSVIAWVVAIGAIAVFSSTVGLHLMIIGAGPVVVTMVQSLLVLRRNPGVAPGSVVVTKSQAPLLWAMVIDIAERVGSGVPTEIRLTATAAAAVTEHPGQVRRLYLGVPLLIGLTVTELRALLAHELGHYAGGHARFVGAIHRGSVALARAVEEMEDTAASNALLWGFSWVQRRLLRAYAWVYDMVSLPVRRGLEFEADAAAAAVVGPRHLAEALRAAFAVTVSWNGFRLRWLEPTHGVVAPDAPLAAFAAMVRDPAYRPTLRRLMESVTDGWSSGTGTHPGTAERLSRLSTLPAAHDPTDLPHEENKAATMAASTLLPPDLAQSVWGRARPKLTTRQPWQDWAAGLTDRQAAADTQGLREAVTRLGAAASPGGLLDLLRAGERLAEELSRAAGTTTPDHERAGALAAAVTSQLGRDLVAGGSARWAPPWSAAPRLVLMTGAADAGLLAHLVRQAVDNPEETGALQNQLIAWGLPLDRPMADLPPAAPSEDPTTALVASAAALEQKRRPAHFAMASLILTIFLIGISFLAHEENPPRHSAPYRPDPFSEYMSLADRLSSSNEWEVNACVAAPTAECYRKLSPYQLLPFQEVTVQPGDTLTAIGCHTGTTVVQLMDLNALTTDRLAIGQTLVTRRSNILTPTQHCCRGAGMIRCPEVAR